MGSLLGQRAVVIGAGIGGLSAAGALADHFEQVDILERDRLAGCVSPRTGTPQDRHPHLLLAGGLQALEEIFPGFERDLAAAGAVSVNVPQDIRYEWPGGAIWPPRDFGLSILSATRPVIEFVLRRRVEAIANIRLRPESRVTEIVPTANVSDVRGIRIEARSGRADTLAADLVVDASGRGAPTSSFLAAHGWEQPAVTEVGVDISYATAIVHVPVDAPPDWKLAVTMCNPPMLALSAGVVPVEGGRWMVLLADRGRKARPENWEAFLKESQRLITPTIHNALRHAAPPDGIWHYRFTANLWKHFERLSRLPRGLLPIADAFCRFNPVYGQGMSAAAKQAQLLRDVLGRSAAEPDPVASLQAGFMAEVGPVLQTPWTMATNTDFAFPETRGERPPDLERSQQSEAALFRAVVEDPVVHRAFLEAMQLLLPFGRLQEPDMRERIEAVSARAAA